jgi:UDP-N-acetylglucosamine 4,6-dehydratase
MTDMVDYTVNNLGEQATPVPLGFEYNSATNPDFLEPSQIRNLVEENANEL